MKLKSFLFPVFLITAFVGFSQEKKLILNQILIDFGSYKHDVYHADLESTRYFGSQSNTAYKLNFMYDSLKSRDNFDNNRNQFHTYLVFLVPKESRFEQRAKIGLGISKGSLFNSSFDYYTFARYDTLTSSQTGKQTYIDSTYSRNISALHQYNLTSISLGYEWHYKPQKRVHLFFESALTLGVSSHSKMVFTDFIQQSDVESQSYSHYSHNSRTEEEIIRLNNTIFNEQITCHIGADFRLGKKENFLGKTYLRLGLGYSMSFFQVSRFSGLSPTNASSFHSNFGIAYKLFD